MCHIIVDTFQNIPVVLFVPDGTKQNYINWKKELCKNMQTQVHSSKFQNSLRSNRDHRIMFSYNHYINIEHQVRTSFTHIFLVYINTICTYPQLHNFLDNTDLKGLTTYVRIRTLGSSLIYTLRPPSETPLLKRLIKNKSCRRRAARLHILYC